MRFRILILSCFLGLIAAFSTVVMAQTLSNAIETQAQISLGFMLNNISRPDAAVGSVIAAPSKSSPNYYFHWIRDAALTMRVIERLYAANDSQHTKWRQMLEDYVQFSRRNQLTPNRSGDIASGGLGEPKFNADGSAYNEPWARPQNDGPALRAVTLIAFANDLLQEGQVAYVKQSLYDGHLPTQTVIKADLEYVAHHWSDTSFDLWEEIAGHHLYTMMAERCALIKGADLALRLGDAGAAAFYRQQADAITLFMQKFWDSHRQFLVETIDQTDGFQKSGLDVAVILAALHSETGDGYFDASSEWMMATANRLIAAFSSLYAINNKGLNLAGLDLAPAVGRYPEDVYNGISTSQGNPWFLATLAFAEYCYRVRTELATVETVDVTAANAPFLQRALNESDLAGQTLAIGAVSSDSAQFAAIESGLSKLGDKFFSTVLYYRGADGSLSEQINRDTGALQGAPNLTWSHAAFITATWAREESLAQ